MCVCVCVCCESSPPDLSLSDTTELYVRARDSTLSRVHHLAQSRRPLVGSITVCFTTAKRAIIFISIQHDGQAENSYARKKKLTKPYPPTSSPSPTLDQQNQERVSERVRLISVARTGLLPVRAYRSGGGNHTIAQSRIRQTPTPTTNSAIPVILTRTTSWCRRDTTNFYFTISNKKRLPCPAADSVQGLRLLA